MALINWNKSKLNKNKFYRTEQFSVMFKYIKKENIQKNYKNLPRKM